MRCHSSNSNHTRRLTTLPCRLWQLLFAPARGGCMSAHSLQEPQAAEEKVNPMKDLFLEKLILNICVGESGDRLTRAAKVRWPCSRSCE